MAVHHRKKKTGLLIVVIIMIALLLFSGIAIVTVYINGPQNVIVTPTTGSQLLDSVQPTIIIPEIPTSGDLSDTGTVDMGVGNDQALNAEDSNEENLNDEDLSN